MKKVVESKPSEFTDLASVSDDKIYICVQGNCIYKLNLELNKTDNAKYVWHHLESSNNYSLYASSLKEAIADKIQCYGYDVYEFDSIRELGKWLSGR